MDVKSEEERELEPPGSDTRCDDAVGDNNSIGARYNSGLRGGERRA